MTELSPEQMEHFKTLLAKEKADQALNHTKEVACATVGGIGALVGLAFRGKIGAIGLGTLGCATGVGLVDLADKTGILPSLDSATNYLNSEVVPMLPKLPASTTRLRSAP